MATTTPYDLVKPLATALEFDAVLATLRRRRRRQVRRHARRPFVWSSGKLAAVRTWAAEHGIDLHQSYAYPTASTARCWLGGHPVAVNPDRRCW